MINIKRLLLLARQMPLAGDEILSGTHSFFSLGHLIQHGQSCLTPDGKASEWKHARKYIDSDTVAESTIDRNPFWPPMSSPLESGVQFNSLKSIEGDEKEYGVLIHYRLLTNEQRQSMINEARRIVEESAGGNPMYRYDISGLFGSLLSYWVFGSKSNPLSGYGLYCSAFTQHVDNILGKEYDSCDATTKNTAPEMRWQFYKSRPDLFEIIRL